MNILILFQVPIVQNVGGVQRVTAILSKELRERGHNVTYLSTSITNEYDALCLDPFQYSIDIRDTKDRQSAAKAYTELLAEKKIDVVISQEATAENLYLLKVTPSQIKKLSVYHIQPFRYVGKERIVKKALRPKGLHRILFRNLCIMFPFLFRFKHLCDDRRIFKRMCSFSDKVVLLSDKFIPRIKKYWPAFPEEKFVSVNNPNTFDVFAPDTKKSVKEKLIIFVGRIEETQKNVRGFIDMWKVFSNLHPDWKAAIIGDGNARDRNQNYAKQIGVSNLTFEGRQSDVQSYYSRAAFVCLTSHYEGWGMSLTEGMAHGCVPVCFDSYESASDIIQNGVDGIIAKSFSADDMSQRISEVADDDNKFNKMSLAAQEKVKKFNIIETVNKWEQLLLS